MQTFCKTGPKKKSWQGKSIGVLVKYQLHPAAVSKTLFDFRLQCDGGVVELPVRNQQRWAKSSDFSSLPSDFAAPCDLEHGHLEGPESVGLRCLEELVRSFDG